MRKEALGMALASFGALGWLVAVPVRTGAG
jgi:hypothetical protein